TDVTGIADIPFVGYVEIPLAVLLQGLDQCFHRSLVRREVRQTSAAGTFGGRLVARERHVRNQAAAVTFGRQPLELAQERLARPALGVNGRDDVVKGTPGSPPAP